MADRRAVLAAPVLGILGAVQTGEDHAAGLRPADALVALLAGNRRFLAGEPRHGHHVAAARVAAREQHPFAAVLGCVDSRVPVEAVFDQGFGALCVIRSGGEVLDRAVLGSVEFAVAELSVKLVVVLGHTRCGAVQAAIRAVRRRTSPDGQIGYLVDQIAPTVRAVGDDPAVVAREHARRTAAAVRELAPVRRRVDTGGLMVTSGLYDVDTGRVELVSG
jgi:carbonic anhydrase